MEDGITRRGVLSLCGVVGIATIAGCSTADKTSPTPSNDGLQDAITIPDGGELQLEPTESITLTDTHA